MLQGALNEYLRLEPALLEAHQRYLTRKQVGKSVRAACPKGISRQPGSPSEWVSNELLISSQIARKGDKLDVDVA
jgi:putative transposase